MRRRYRDAAYLGTRGSDVIVLNVPGIDAHQLWVKLTRCQSKPHKCVICDQPTSREDRIWRPITNKANRMDRICSACVERIKTIPLSKA